jgi:spectinomycin phosphotransferase
MVQGNPQNMLEKPDLEDNRITTCLKDAYGLRVTGLTFLPLGADQNTAVYRITGSDRRHYFLKLRKADFIEASVTIPYFLSQSGMKQVIPPIPTRTGKLWAALNPYKVILYPFIEGHDGYENRLTFEQWVAFGRALKQFHSTDFPAGLTEKVPQENFSTRWRATVKKFYQRFRHEAFIEPAAAELTGFLKSKETETMDLINRAERYAQVLQEQPSPFILCHADIHGWNLLIDHQAALYMVDWDTLLFAPKERDLMFIGSGPGDSGYTPQQEEAMFYQGYGQTDVNQIALAYYRYERIIEDLAVYCNQIFLSDQGGKDRLTAVENVKSNYQPNGTINKAIQADPGL